MFLPDQPDRDEPDLTAKDVIGAVLALTSVIVFGYICIRVAVAAFA